jgi:hypothetical protein
MKDRIRPASGLAVAFLLLLPLSSSLARNGSTQDPPGFEVRPHLGSRLVQPSDPLDAGGPPGDDDTPNRDRDRQGQGTIKGTVTWDRGPGDVDSRIWSLRELAAGLRLRLLRILRAW